MHISKLKLGTLGFVGVFIALFVTIGVMGQYVNKIVITGDPEVISYVKTLSYYYTNYVNKDVSIDVNAPGSSQAIKDVKDGIADYGMIARTLTSLEASDENIVTTDITLANEAFVFVVNNDFNVDLIGEMKIDTCAHMFIEGNKTWREYVKDDLDGLEPDDSKELRKERDDVYKDIKLIPVQRRKGDGLRESFQEEASIEALLSGNEEGKTIENYSDKVGITKDSDGEIIQYVKQNLGAVGYVRYAAYKANIKQVKMLPITNAAGESIRNLSIENFKTDNPKKTYPLKRGFNYFYNKNNTNKLASDFFDWITTGYDTNQFLDYLDDGVVKDKDGKVDKGTIPFEIGSQDSIIPDYVTYRRQKVEKLLKPEISAAMEKFPFKNEYDNDMNEVPIEIDSDIDLPSKIDNVSFNYLYSSNYEVIDPDLEPNKGIVTPQQEDTLVELEVEVVAGNKTKENLQYSTKIKLLFNVKGTN